MDIVGAKSDPPEFESKGTGDTNSLFLHLPRKSHTTLNKKQSLCPKKVQQKMLCVLLGQVLDTGSHVNYLH